MMIEKILEEFETTQELMLKELKKINAKGDLSKEELCAIKEIAETIYKMQIAEAMLEESEGMSEYYDDGMMEEGYYAGGSRGGSQRGGSSRGSYAGGGGSREGGSQRGSMARGRSPRTGRFVSRRGGSYAGGGSGGSNMDGGSMSRHSIEDRMIAALEDQMDYAGSDYERQMVGDWINKIRAGEMK